MTDTPAPSDRPRPRPRPAAGKGPLSSPEELAEADKASSAPVEDAGDTAEDSAGTPGIKIPSWRLPRLRVPTSRLSMITAAVLIAVLAVANVILAVKNSSRTDRIDRLNAVQQAEMSASAAARVAVPKVLSYSYKTLDADLARARSVLTGSFATEYGQLVQKVIAPTATAQKTVTTAGVKGVAIVQASEKTVSVLVFINQTTSSAASKTPRIDGSRATVTMTKVDGVWRISKLTPV